MSNRSKYLDPGWFGGSCLIVKDCERWALIADWENTTVNKGVPGNTDDPRTKQFYHGARSELRPGDLIDPGNSQGLGEGNRMTICVYLTPHLDEAIWKTEIAVGEGPGRVYLVQSIGQVEDAPPR